MRVVWAVLLGCVAVVLPALAAREPAPQAAFEVGQRWEYDARAEDAGTSLLIVKIDPDPKHGRIVFVDIDNVTLRGEPGILPLVPFSERALRKSVRKLQGRELPPAFSEDDYQEWKKTIHEANAPFLYTVPVKEALRRLAE